MNVPSAIWALNQADAEVEPATVSKAFATGTKPVYRLTTHLGCSIRATANHKFLSIAGWQRFDHLYPGSNIALPRQYTSTPPGGSLAPHVTSDIFWDRSRFHPASRRRRSLRSDRPRPAQLHRQRPLRPQLDRARRRSRRLHLPRRDLQPRERRVAGTRRAHRRQEQKRTDRAPSIWRSSARPPPSAACRGNRLPDVSAPTAPAIDTGAAVAAPGVGGDRPRRAGLEPARPAPAGRRRGDPRGGQGRRLRTRRDRVARALEREGVDWLGVALVEEGAKLRRAGVGLPILVLGTIQSGEIEEARAHGLTPAVSSLDQLRMWAARGRRAREPAPRPQSFHLKVDTGMHRLGLPPADWARGRRAARRDTIASPRRPAVAPRRIRDARRRLHRRTGRAVRARARDLPRAARAPRQQRRGPAPSRRRAIPWCAPASRSTASTPRDASASWSASCGQSTPGAGARDRRRRARRLRRFVGGDATQPHRRGAARLRRRLPVAPRQPGARVDRRRRSCRWSAR